MLKFLDRVCRSSSDQAAFARFACVGGAIALIDVLVLYLMLYAGADRYSGRVVSLGLAMTAGYILNRYFTFHHVTVDRALWHSMLRHFGVHSVGAGINIGVYAIVLLIGEQMGGEVMAGRTLPLLGVWIGGLVGMSFNFFFSNKLVFDR